MMIGDEDAQVQMAIRRSLADKADPPSPPPRLLAPRPPLRPALHEVAGVFPDPAHAAVEPAPASSSQEVPIAIPRVFLLSGGENQVLPPNEHEVFHTTVSVWACAEFFKSPRSGSSLAARRSARCFAHNHCLTSGGKRQSSYSIGFSFVIGRAGTLYDYVSRGRTVLLLQTDPYEKRSPLVRSGKTTLAQVGHDQCRSNS